MESNVYLMRDTVEPIMDSNFERIKRRKEVEDLIESLENIMATVGTEINWLLNTTHHLDKNTLINLKQIIANQVAIAAENASSGIDVCITREAMRAKL